MPIRLSFLFILLFSFCSHTEQKTGMSSTYFIQQSNFKIKAANKVNGVSFESPPRMFPSENLGALDSIKANWIGLIPFGFSYPNGQKVHFNSDRQWWGERPEGIEKICDYANEYKLNVMIKPQVWIPGSWVGEFDIESKKDLEEWKTTYTDYILTFAQIAQDKKADLFCVGTEYKKLAVKHPDFWRNLIKQVRAVYDGPVTYAANWDHYQNISFWDELDFVGINAYFPLVEKPLPTVNETKQAWETHKVEMQRFSKQINKPILFTEYGYMSCDYAAWKTWENEDKSPPVNLEAQAIAYQALYESLWNQDWWAGGFLWEWQATHDKAGGPTDKHYSPQRKPAEKVIRSFFETN